MRNPGACPVHVPFPTEKGGAGAADGGVNQETALPYFLLQPGYPQAILGVAGPAGLAAATAPTSSCFMSAHYVLSHHFHCLIHPHRIASHPIGQEGKLKHRDVV